MLGVNLLKKVLMVLFRSTTSYTHQQDKDLSCVIVEC